MKKKNKKEKPLYDQLKEKGDIIKSFAFAMIHHDPKQAMKISGVEKYEEQKDGSAGFIKRSIDDIFRYIRVLQKRNEYLERTNSNLVYMVEIAEERIKNLEIILNKYENITRK